MTTLDLSNPKHVAQYLSATPWAAKSVTTLSGGYTNFPFRIELVEPFQGKETVILKHGKSIPLGKEHLLSTERQKNEVGAMNKMREILPSNALARVPIVYLHDETNHVIIMEDAGRDAVNLKELLRRSDPPSPATGATIGRVLGEFIANLHAWGMTDQGRASLDLFDGYPQARGICAWATYGRLVDTVTGKSESIPLIHDPPLRVTSEELDKISKIAEEGAEEMRVSRETTTMGDFWPGNVLVDLGRGSDGSEKVRKVLVVDWEVARPGVAAFDVGQFQAEIFTVQHFNPVCGPASEALSVAFLEGYLSIQPELDRQKAAQHLAAHLVIWVPRAGWEPAEKTRALVEHGLRSITLIPLKPPAEILRGTNLLSYSYVHCDKPTSDEPEPESEVRYGTWDSPIEGVIDKWTIRPNDTVSAKQAKGKPVLFVNEPCKHGMQLGGLCCLCGKDMTEFDYTGFSDASRASIQMTHSANGPTVSLEEARRIEQETAAHLLKSQKLTLIVDLDQTIVHATVDPTVGDWISEGAAWEARQAKRRIEFEAKVKAQVKAKAETNGDGGGTGAATHAADGDGKEAGLSLQLEPDPNDEVNPNWEALKDVKKFRLGPEAFLPPTGIRPSGSRKGKERAIENDGCLYYVKPRPGWQEFLSHVSTKYEMHVYTMGTRAYAEEVCAAIDPEGVFFGGRILSRDESGSLTQKSLQRLFPCDTSMVVIIDDRADVWEWSPNLVKVIPYDFFVGIGDINSAFLPKITPLTPSVPSQPPPTSPDPTAPPPHSSSTDPTLPTLSSVSEVSSETAIHETSPTLVGSDDEDLEKRSMLTRNSIALEAQLEERPLAKKQEELEEQEQKEEAQDQSDGTVSEHDGKGAELAEVKADATPQPHPHKHTAKALLRNDDYELLRVKALLDQVHQTFYDAYELSQALRGPPSPVTKKGRRRPSIVDEDAPLYDVKAIIPAIRQMTFAGFRIVFSSVIPLDVPPETTDIWRTAVAFGAECYKELNPRITHVVANKRGTVKVDQARRLQRTTNPSIKIVWLAWFNDSLALWKRQDETPYLLDDPSQRSATPPLAPPIQGVGLGFGSTGSGGSEGDDDVKSSDDADDAEIEGHAISSDPEPDADDWDFDVHNPPSTSTTRANGNTQATGTGTSTPATEDALKELEGSEELKIDIDWASMNAEFDEWMDGDSSDEGEEAGGDDGKSNPAGSGNVDSKHMDVSDGEWTDETNSIISTPRSKRKRLRSFTPSEVNSAVSSTGDPLLRSPLSKRKKLSADRFGAGSKLETHAIPAPDFVASARSSRAGSLAPSENGTGVGSKPGTPRKDRRANSGEDDGEDGDDDGSEEAFDIDDDFLARELEEELG